MREDSTPIAVIGGSGRQGFGLAVRWAKAGYPIIIGSRDPARAAEAAERVRAAAGPGGAAAGSGGPAQVSGAANAEAAAAGGIVVLTIPYAGAAAILAEINAGIDGKPVVSTMVPLRKGKPPEIERIEQGSAAEAVQAALPGARVVAAFHTVSEHALRRDDQPLEGDVLLCGDDAEAKAATAALVETLGLRALDAGPLSQAGTLERLAAVVISLNQRYRRKAIGVRFTGL